MPVFVQPAFAAPSCAGRSATIVGTARDNTLRGTAGRDVIVGGKGDDEVGQRKLSVTADTYTHVLVDGELDYAGVL